MNSSFSDSCSLYICREFYNRFCQPYCNFVCPLFNFKCEKHWTMFFRIAGGCMQPCIDDWIWGFSGNERAAHHRDHTNAH